jgi:hypothetical protein
MPARRPPPLPRQGVLPSEFQGGLYELFPVAALAADAARDAAARQAAGMHAASRAEAAGEGGACNQKKADDVIDLC